MKALTGLILLIMLCGCSESQNTDAQSATNLIERYNKPVDAAGAAADQVQELREQE
ncbi:MAG TPA: hypothetical protein VJ904_02965 [Tichowtungia sp.]|nr:hypothetical protein [Tichowtungia sp.]